MNNNQTKSAKILYELYSEYAYIAREKNDISLPDFAEATIKNLITDLYHARDLSLSYEDILEIYLVLIRKIVTTFFEHNSHNLILKGI